jgi:hypothetical protein
MNRWTIHECRDHPWAVDFWQAAGYAEDLRIARYVKK